MSCLSLYWNTDANLLGSTDLPDDWAVRNNNMHCRKYLCMRMFVLTYVHKLLSAVYSVMV